MRNICVILCLFIFIPSSFAQWKSYYPESKLSKKEQAKKENEKNRKLFEIHFFDALKAKSLENYEEALKCFAKCIKLQPNIPTSFYEAAAINMKNGSYTVAVDQIMEAVRIDPKNRWYLLLYAEILFNKQDFDNAAKQYKKLIALEPGNEQLYFKLSDTYIYANELSKAIDVYDDLQQYKGVDRMLSIQKHKLYRELNNIKGAIRELNIILQTFPNDIEVLEILSELYLLNDEKEKAFEIFKSLATIAPNNGRVHLTLADYYRENGQNDKSYAELKLAFKSPRLNIDTKVRILISYYQLIAMDKNMATQAYELAKILIQTHPNDLKSRVVFADILYTDSKYQKAKEQYLLVLEQDKSKSQVWSQVLFIQAEQNDFEGMIKTSKEALDYFPSEPLFYYFNGISNKRFSHHDEAIDALQTGIEFVVDNKNLLLEFYSSLAETYHSTNQHKLSDKYYEKALDVDSNNVFVLNNYSYYLSLRKIRLEKAKAMSFKCNQIAPDNGTYQDTYAWILYSLGEYIEAREWILKALLNGGEKSAVIVEHYGDILYKLGDLEGALDQWRKSKELGGQSQFLIQKINDKKLYE